MWTTHRVSGNVARAGLHRSHGMFCPASDTNARLVFGGAEEKPTSVDQMFRHSPAGLVRVTLANGVKDAPVQTERVFFRHDLRRDLDQLCQALMNDSKHQTADAIRGNAEDRMVEQKILGDKTSVIFPSLFHRSQHSTQFLDVFCGGSLGSTRCEFGLDNQSSLHQLMKGDAIEQNQELHGFAEDGCCAGIQVGAISYPLRDNAHDLEHFQRLPQ